MRKVTIGFNAVPALLGGRSTAATAFWNAEGVALRASGAGLPRVPRRRVRRARPTPSSSSRHARDAPTTSPTSSSGTVAALRRGYEEALKDPELAVETLVARNRGLDRELVIAELPAVGAAFTAAGTASASCTATCWRRGRGGRPTR